MLLFPPEEKAVCQKNLHGRCVLGLSRSMYEACPVDDSPNVGNDVEIDGAVRQMT